MKKRNSVTQILKSDDPEKLVVFKAVSLQDQIRFYINQNQYIAAIEHERGVEIKLNDKLKEKREEKKRKKSTISIIKDNLKEFIILFLIAIVLSMSCCIGATYFSIILNTHIVSLFFVHIVYFIAHIISSLMIALMECDFCIKSKHSAEHMMINFLETNKRLPKSIEEVKKCSRFSEECGGRKLIKAIAEKFVRSIIGGLFAVITTIIVEFLFHNYAVNSMVFIVVYILFYFMIGKLILKYNFFYLIIRIIVDEMLTHIVQYATTTSKVKDEDIILAYAAAQAWMYVVYPEFYNEEEEDVFWKKYFEI